MFSLAKKITLVTGAGRGIGRAIALALAKAGATVAVMARTAVEVEGAVADIKKAGGQGVAIVADLSQKNGAGQVIEQVTAKLGPVDILVNNAGIGSSSNPKPVAEFDDAFWELSLYLNLTVPYKLSKAVLPHMRQQKWGRIINIASINSKMPSLHGAAYAASKHGLLGLTRTLALEIAREGITVNAICPGPVHTVMNDKRIEYDAQRRGMSFAELEQAMTPIGGRLEPEDIAPLAVYLASNEARMVTGQAYNICGGVLLY
ncbi:MAG TPA: SDR family NAD(P)-dependent oxidoreductase [Gemmataceae bacterium]|nr:SDR family NAD(P)-dependent oxidoreductase [Gemmataceae bacterium]